MVIGNESRNKIRLFGWFPLPTPPTPRPALPQQIKEIKKLLQTDSPDLLGM